MNVAQLQCHGCNRTFTRNGLSKHIRLTHDVRCHAAYGSAQGQNQPRPVPHASGKSPLASIRIDPPTIPDEDCEGHATNEDLVHLSSGKFSSMCVIDEI
jgi:hypothetical protein